MSRELLPYSRARWSRRLIDSGVIAGAMVAALGS